MKGGETYPRKELVETHKNIQIYFKYSPRTPTRMCNLYYVMNFKKLTFNSEDKIEKSLNLGDKIVRYLNLEDKIRR